MVPAQPHELLWYAAATQVAILRWPDDADERARLDRDGRPRLLVLDADNDAPSCNTCLEDWIRLPASDHDIRVRITALEARFARHPHAPTLDASGQLRFRDKDVFVTPRESAIAAELVRQFRKVVPDEDLLKLLWPDGGGNPDSLRAVIHRLRKRIHAVGLTITTNRHYGHVMSEAA
jgi:DNA-binding response OmpR family regulator